MESPLSWVSDIVETEVSENNNHYYISSYVDYANSWSVERFKVTVSVSSKCLPETLKIYTTIKAKVKTEGSVGI